MQLLSGLLVRFSVHARCCKTLQQFCTEQLGTHVHVN